MNAEEMLTSVWQYSPHLLAVTSVFLVFLIGSCHVLLHKRDRRAAVGWIGMIWLSPLIGITLYLLLGINRVQRRAARRGARATGQRSASAVEKASNPPPVINPEELPAAARHLAPLEHLVEELTDRDLLHGNRVQPLHNGDETYPAMLAAIEAAQTTISLCSYIFNHDRIGKQFVEALGRAVKRGVQTRVIVDAIGSRYHFPSIRGPLRAARVPHAMFLPTLTPGRFSYSNLRTHRKLLIVDGRLGFTGGVNIQEGEALELRPAFAIQDLHFCLAGPIVRQMQEVFLNDWQFSAGETLEGDAWLPNLESEGSVLARGISAGPDEDVDKRRLTLLGAIGCARTSILIVTPYFLPDDSLIAALDVAALRGVTVDIVLPEKNNLRSVQWASMAVLWQVLERGCRVWLSPPPFDHTKLMVVDSAWTMFGSGNWDPRSLRLNFEFDVECYDELLASTMQRLACKKRDSAKPLTLAQINGRNIPTKLRDGVASLLTPYL